MTGTRAETRVGWCPSVATPMAADDGLLVRVKPTASVLTSAQVRILAESCAAYGNGQIDLTNRSNLQIRGLRPDTTAPFAEAMQTALRGALYGGQAGEDGEGKADRFSVARHGLLSPLGDAPASSSPTFSTTLGLRRGCSPRSSASFPPIARG